MKKMLLILIASDKIYCVAMFIIPYFTIKLSNVWNSFGYDINEWFNPNVFIKAYVYKDEVLQLTKHIKNITRARTSGMSLPPPSTPQITVAQIVSFSSDGSLVLRHKTFISLKLWLCFPRWIKSCHIIYSYISDQRVSLQVSMILIT